MFSAKLMVTCGENAFAAVNLEEITAATVQYGNAILTYKCPFCEQFHAVIVGQEQGNP